MKTRYVFAALVAVALVSGGMQSVAWGAEVSPEQREAMQLKFEELRERLALTPEQEAKIAPLVQERNEKLKALRGSGGGEASRRERIAMLKEARGIQQEFVEQVEPMLTAEQKKEWAAIREEMKEAAKARRRDR
jgi:protein CpxP